MSPSVSRRQALGRLAVLAAATVLAPARQALAAARTAGTVTHPDPRPGITAERVLPAGDVPKKSRPAYRVAREIPGILDGLYCHCDCAERDGRRSLLSCFEVKMATTCGICRGEAVMAGRLHARGRSLDEIRAAVDEEYG